MIVIEKSEAFKPTNDYVFKRIFGHVGNEIITKGFINSILDDEIESVNLEGNTILEKDLIDDKVGILDVKAILNNKILCDIEMQVVTYSNIEKRVMFYWSKLYTSNIKEGQRYNSLNRTIAILVADFELEKLKAIPKGHTKWKIREEDFPKTILTDVCEIHIIELPKLKRLIKNSKVSEKEKILARWIKFLLAPNELEENDMENNESLKKAKEEFDTIQKDEYEQRMAELRMKHIRDTKEVEAYGYEKGLKDGVERGIEQGIEKGLEQGERKTKIKMAKKMLEDGIDRETIMKYTGLTENEIEELK